MRRFGAQAGRLLPFVVGAILAWPPALALGRAATAVDPGDAITAALVIRAARIMPAVGLPGVTLAVTYDVINTSTVPISVPPDEQALHPVAWVTEFPERLGTDPTIGAALPPQVRTLRLEDLGPGSDLLPGAHWHHRTEIRTTGFPPGGYRYTIRLERPGYHEPAFATADLSFRLLSITNEWRAELGTRGVNGYGTVRLLGDGDGVGGGQVVLHLLGLGSGRTWAVGLARGSCSRPIAIASVRRLTTDRYGAWSGTTALGSAAVSAMRRAARPGPLLLRLVSGTAARCAVLAAVPLYAASLGHWTARPLPEVTGRFGSDGALPTDVIRTATGYVAAGLDWSPGAVDLVAWISPDGLTWQEAKVEPGGTTARGARLARHGDRLVLVTDDGAFWSDDGGLSWHIAATPPTGHLPDFFYGSVAPTVADTSAGVVAVTEWPVQPGQPQCGTQTWLSADGSTWRSLGYSWPLWRLDPSALAAGPDGTLVLAGNDCSDHAVILRSANGGTTWVRGTGAALSLSRTVTTVARTASGYVAFGRGAADKATRVYVSRDGLAWRLTQTITAPGMDWFDVTTVFPLGPGYVALAGLTAAADWFQSGVLVSPDGATWRWAPYPAAPFGTVMEAGLSDGPQLIAVGDNYNMMDDAHAPLVWRGVVSALP